MSLLERIRELSKAKIKLNNDIKEFCQDKNNPLDDRWDLFIEADVGQDERWIVYWDCIDEEDITYDGNLIHAERRQTVHVSDIVERIEDADGDYDDFKTENLSVEAFKEEALKRWIKSYDYDW